MDLEQRVRALVAPRLLDVPSALARRVAGAPERDGRYTLEPRIQLLMRVQQLAGAGGFETLGSVEAARDEYRTICALLGRPERPAPLTHDRVITHGERRVPVRIYRPGSAGPYPAIVYFHGGGFVIGDLETHDPVCRRLCTDVGAVVVAVDYRLAPEHPFPAAIEDCEAAARWVLEEGPTLGVDAARVALAGDSAGGNLAVNVGQRVDGLRFQLLIYPSSDVLADTPSKRRCREGFGLDQSTVDWFVAQYAQDHDVADPGISPLRSEALGRCPPTRVVMAGFDVLRDEGDALADAIAGAGVETTRIVHGSLTHGFIHYTRLGPARDALEDAIAALRRALDA
ncbi:MAG TPA: alpha/beta hydrolase [Polyangiaceae bacterium LLY-WYZ-15_(1-7)]|nr:alpha/beta hydrolase [Polyangiaceae bacterium LLY-WYZ-15_(1-7)]HJL09866.1 alpha/beta hydrolase [Polyangiaceae bacterium LLY-WYZ-15_(1-7)]HJL22037.1 alpha/beta hydrolase [Polyangiaceae bacterium LLY-WYZ-15_(1-7)]HJL38173.1 alpha/beta hydrolase [Polyangiaceae bacterium LLY-WYZ-15_(1-7)]HJL47703.1 alpha/beta hydrolase [Polyangiaceae bacterium LLY-WYZ-15_(1-7)]